MGPIIDRQASDEQLMALVQAGGSQAFAELYARHYARALGVALAICNDHHHAEDVVQEGFLSIWRGRDTYRRNGGSLSTWAMEVVRNRAIDSIRREGAGKRPRLTDTEIGEIADAAVSSPLDQIVIRSERDEGHIGLDASLRRLPAAQAEVITLAYFEELSHTQIAARLTLPEGTVKGRMRLAMEKLRDAMGVGA